MIRRGVPVDGVLLLDKPYDITSNAALQRAKRAAGAARAGHVGTLDPLATGLLPVCFGEATKFARWLADADKTYRATIRFGVTTATGDAEGEILARRPIEFDGPALEAALAGLRGEIDQVPPMHSALKHEGRPLYAYARAGKTVEREPRRVTVHAVELQQWVPPDAVVALRVSKGTYVRSLAEALGERLGSGAHLAALRRTVVAALDVADAVPLEVWETLSVGQQASRLRPVDELLVALPRCELPEQSVRRFCQGRAVVIDGATNAGEVRVYAAREGRFVGVGRQDAGGLLLPSRLLAHPPGEAVPEEPKLLEKPILPRVKYAPFCGD